MEVAVGVVVVVVEHRAETRGGGCSTIETSAVKRKALAVFAQFHLQPLDLTPKQSILMVGSV